MTAITPAIRPAIGPAIRSAFEGGGAPSLASQVAALFAASEPGAWYDPANLSTLFQDSAFTVPVTAVEQPVGGMLDLSGRGNHATQATTTKRPIYSRRVNLLTKTEDATGWGYYGSSFSASTKDVDEGFVITQLKSSGFRSAAINTDYPGGSSPLSNITIVRSIEAKYVNCNTFTLGGASAAAQIIFNVLTGSVVTNAGSLPVDVTPLADGWFRFEFWCSRASSGATELSAYFEWGTGSIGDAIKVRKPSFAMFSLGYTNTVPYQRVNTSVDYDADPAKFPAYLRFDGVDDALQTGNIDFTGTDKMTVWAGVTKLSDAGMQIITELGASFGNVGSFALRGPTSAEANNFGAPINTGAIKEALSGLATAPVSAVLSGVFDGVGDPSAYLRVGGVQTASGAGASGAAKFLNQSLHIGARAGSSFYFNGRLYSLIVRGAQSTLSQIKATELYMKKKVGIA